MLEQTALSTGWTGLLQIFRTILEVLVGLSVVFGAYIAYKKFKNKKTKNNNEGE